MVISKPMDWGVLSYLTISRLGSVWVLIFVFASSGIRALGFSLVMDLGR